MKLVMTLVVRNEADIIDAQIAFHLNAGVDFVIATDTGSGDGTREILEDYVRSGWLHCLTAPFPGFSQEGSVTQMARLAATRFAADWIINSDADEFWWGRGGSLKEVLAAVPSRFGSVRGMWRHFVARPGDGFFAERMTVRLCVPVTHRDHAFSPHFKTVHRADPEVRVGGGNHEAFGPQLLPLQGWYPIDILHFPLRSLEQCARKYVQWWIAVRGRPNPHVGDGYEAYRQGRMREFYNSHAIDDEALKQGLRDGTLALDTRVRDVLLSLRASRPASAGEFEPSAFPAHPGSADGAIDQGYLSEIGTLEDQTALSRAQRRLEALETRLSALETRFPSRLRARSGSGSQ